MAKEWSLQLALFDYVLVEEVEEAQRLVDCAGMVNEAGVLDLTRAREYQLVAAEEPGNLNEISRAPAEEEPAGRPDEEQQGWAVRPAESGAARKLVVEGGVQYVKSAKEAVHSTMEGSVVVAEEPSEAHLEARAAVFAVAVEVEPVAAAEGAAEAAGAAIVAMAVGEAHYVVGKVVPT